MNELEKRFHNEMVNLYKTAKEELGYNATRFLQMISEQGGVATARTLINKPGGTEGFAYLWEKGRLDLSVEACVSKPEYKDLFTEQERNYCRSILIEHGYTVLL